MNDTTGFVKMVADAKTDRMLGCHILGPRAGDLIAELVAGAAFRASAEDIALTVHAHPTLAEAVKEAALDVHGEVLHI
jgi:dihydrolipoamide dehydrogenase